MITVMVAEVGFGRARYCAERSCKMQRFASLYERAESVGEALGNAEWMNGLGFERTASVDGML